MKSDKTAKIPDGVTVIIGYGLLDLSGLEWNIGEWSEGDMYIYLSDKGSKDFIKRLIEEKNFFLFTRSYWGDDKEEDYYNEYDKNYYYFDTAFRRNEELNGNISLSIDPDENGYDLILKQYLALSNPFMNWDKIPWSDVK